MKLCFSIIGILLLLNAFSQTGRKLDYHFSHIVPSGRLAGNHVLFITQDDKGYIWLCSLIDGLQRYDGLRFQNFGEQFFNKETNSYEIHELAFFEGLLYVKSSNRIFIFDPIRRRFDQVPIHEDSKTVSFFNDKGDIWKVDKYSVSMYDKNGNKKSEEIFLNNRVRVNSLLIYDSARKNYWYAKGSELHLLDESSHKVYNTRNTGKHPLLDFIGSKYRFDIANMIIDGDDNLWISFWSEKFFKFNLKTNQIKEYSISRIFGKEALSLLKNPLGVNNLFVDNHNQLWVPTYGAGLLMYNRETEAFDYMVYEKDNLHSIQYNYENKAMLQDRQDNLWIGTDRGISLFNPYREYFKIIRNKEGQGSSLLSSEISVAFQSRDKDLWVGSWGDGIVVFDSTLNFKKTFKFDLNLSTNMIWSFAEDKMGRIWVGCQTGWVNRFNPAKNEFDKPFRISDLKSTISSMTSDPGGNIFLGYFDGSIVKWDAEKDSFFLFKHYASNGGRAVPVEFMLSDKKQNLWVISGKYLYRYDVKKLKYVDSIPVYSENMAVDYINTHLSFTQIEDSIFLITSYKGKPGYLNFYTRDFKELQVPEEIVRKRISDIERDQNGKIWFTAGWDLYQLTPGNPSQLTSYNIDNKVINSPFRQHGMVHVKGGRRGIWTATELLIFDPAQLVNSINELKLNSPVITGLKVFNRYILLDSILENKGKIKLKPGQNFITIEFAPLLYAPLQRIKYFYKLSGVNTDWVEADNFYSASYTNLSPGEYLFSVRPEGSTLPDQIVSLHIEITPPFYHTWWFYVLFSVAVALLITLLIRRRIKVVRREGEFKHKMLETEMAALRAQMNPHFIFNCLSAIDNLIQNGDRDEATTYLARFAKLIRNVLDSSKNNTIAFYKDYETVKLFVEMEQFRKGDKFAYELHADPELMDGDYSVPPMLIQPFIENAIHHGLANKMHGKKVLTVEARLNGDSIYYTVTDTGVGRARAEELKKINNPQHTSYGIDISKERISTYNNLGQTGKGKFDEDCLVITDLKDGNGDPQGTRVEIRLKIHSTE
ncbi:MAG: histidine kinase [Chitinophagaceae bacterium]|nr:histidine kinase [Chitinophagaceae bacterium]